MPLVVPNVGSRQKYLRYRMAVFREQLVVHIHKLALTDGSRRLFRRHISRLSLERQLSHAHSDSAGGYEDYLMTRVLEIAHDLAELLCSSDVETAVRVGKR